MSQNTAEHSIKHDGPAGQWPARIALAVALSVMIMAVAVFVGIRFALVLLLGLGIGLTLEGLRFGFAGPWRAVLIRREPAGLLAQLAAIGAVSVAAFPLMQAGAGEIVGAHAPVGVAMVGGAFVFGLCMQLVLGCGSGTLVNAGSGNAVGLAVLPFFALGSFAGAYHLDWWMGLGTAPTVTLSGLFGPLSGLFLTLIGLAFVAFVAWRAAAPADRVIPRRLWLAAAAVAALAVLHLIVAGQPWGVVYGLGLWAAKTFQLAGADLAGSAFWSAAGQTERLRQSVLTDMTSLTNIGLIVGAFAVATWRGDTAAPRTRLPVKGWAAAIIAGLVMGYASRLAFGCNVGAFFSGISTGSLHGWVWFAAAFAGSAAGIRLRPRLGLEPQS